MPVYVKLSTSSVVDRVFYVHYIVHMDTKTTLSISEARKKIFEIADEVQKPNTHYTLTENGRPKMVLISASEFESWQTTREVVREFPYLEKDIEIADNGYRRGEYITLGKLLAAEGFVLADKGAQKYGIPASRTKKRAKKTR